MNLHINQSILRRLQPPLSVKWLDDKTHKLIAIATSLVILLLVGLYVKQGAPLAFSQCPVRAITGIKCPGCGGTRMARSIANLKIVDALYYNAMAMIVIAYLSAVFGYNIYLVVRHNRFVTIQQSHAYGIMTIFVLFAILRNMPFYPMY